MNNPDRYETIVRQYSEPLYWHIRRMVVCHEDAQDILQDTLTSIFLSFHQLKDPSKTQAWLYTIATNKARRFLRKRSRQLGGEDITEYLSDRLADSPYVNYEKAEAIDLQKALLKLPETQRLVFNLRFFDEMEYEQISRITGSSMDSVRVNYHLAKKKVAQFIHEEQF